MPEIIKFLAATDYFERIRKERRPTIKGKNKTKHKGRCEAEAIKDVNNKGTYSMISVV